LLGLATWICGVAGRAVPGREKEVVASWDFGLRLELEVAGWGEGMRGLERGIRYGRNWGCLRSALKLEED
jgi:hypothetical protein